MCPCIDDPVGSPIVEILHRVEGGDVERGSNLGKILVFAIVHFSLNSISLLLALLIAHLLASSFNCAYYLIVD